MNHDMKILVIGPSWVGDMVMSQSLYKELKQLHPYATIDVLAPGWCGPLLERMPEVNRAIEMPIGHGAFNLKGRWRIGRSLKTRAVHSRLRVAQLCKVSFDSSIRWYTKPYRLER